MRYALPTILLVLPTALALRALPAALQAAESPEPCPTQPASPELAGLMGTWALDTFDGKDPEQEMAVQFLDASKALVYIGAAATPVEASYGVNCCGNLVITPANSDEAPAFAPLVAAFEATEQSLTLFAVEGDWVFTRVSTATQGE